MIPPLIDSHAHIDFRGYNEDRDACILRAREAGVQIIVDVGNGDIREGSHEKAQQIADAYPFIYTTVGVHPHDASLYSDELEHYLLELAKHPKVIAWGECGLDYYYHNSPAEVQRRVFIRQLELARGLGLPVVIHTRDAEADTEAILRDYWTAELGGILHCFTGSYKLANAGVEMGLMVSFSGVLTFKKSLELRKIAAQLPLESILIETDCPFLSPEPYRGKRNEPVRVLEVAEALAKARGCALEDVAAATTANFFKLFKIAQLA